MKPQKKIRIDSIIITSIPFIDAPNIAGKSKSKKKKNYNKNYILISEKPKEI